MSKKLFLLPLLLALLTLSGLACNLTGPAPTATIEPGITLVMTDTPVLTNEPEDDQGIVSTATNTILVTATPFYVPPPTARPTATQIVLSQPTATPVCNLAPRLDVGGTARVSPGPLPNALRSAPGTGSNSTVIGNIPSEASFAVLNGPVCADGYQWWQVRADVGVGWTAEGEYGEYWLEPLSCGNTMPTRLTLGQLGQVTLDPPLDNLMRWEPVDAGNSNVVGAIPPGGVFTVLAGPTCGAAGKAWWYVNYNGVLGWTAEGNQSVYWLQPYSDEVIELIDDWHGTIVDLHKTAPSSSPDDYFIHTDDPANTRYGIDSTDPALRGQIVSLRDTGTTVRIWGELRRNVPDYNETQINVTQLIIGLAPTPSEPACTLPPELSVGYTGRVTPGLPNVVRTSPGLDSPRTEVSLPGGALFNVVNGPICDDGYYWWQVESASVSGWTVEGEGDTYWLEPVLCANGMRSRLLPGRSARVTTDPPLANSVRSMPDSAGVYLGSIQPGESFSVVGGPQCDTGGKLWWRVDYKGLVGWTAEGDNGVYWLEPNW